MQASPDRVRAAWEREVQKKLGDSDISLGDLEQILLSLFSSSTADLEYRISELERQVAFNNTDDIDEKLREIDRRTAWDSAQKS